MIMTVKEIVADYLKENGYDGLCRHECGCSLDDFWPCEGCDDPAQCKPAYKHKDGLMYEVLED